jgi:hypothetical protein
VNLTQITSLRNTVVHPASNEKRCYRFLPQQRPLTGLGRFIKDFAVDLEDAMQRTHGVTPDSSFKLYLSSLIGFLIALNISLARLASMS